MRWKAPAVLVVLALVTGGVVVLAGGDRAAPAAANAAVNTELVQAGPLSAIVSLHGTLTYRAHADGSPYAAINQARGVYTRLPDVGDEVGCGDVLYRVDEHPVRLLCGTVPAYRDLRRGDTGKDVRQLNRNLRVPSGNRFTARTEQALKRHLHARTLGIDDAIFLPKPVRISKVIGMLGGAARPGALVAQATSDTLDVHVDLDASQQGEVKRGDSARITLPGNRSVTGTVSEIGTVAQSAGKGTDVGDATLPASIRLDDPAQAGGLDRAPVQADITTRGVEHALSVPVTALVGKSGGGFAVEVVRAGGQRDLVAVKLGLFDTAGGRVQVEGELAQGDRVVVPSL